MRPPHMIQQHYTDGQHSLGDLVQGALSRSSFLTGRHVQVELAHDTVVLKGVVTSYYHKQLAQEALRQVEGISQIRNELVVMSR